MILPPPRTPPASGSFVYRYGSADHLDWLETALLHHKLYIPLASELNDLRDARPKVHRPTLEEWVHFMKDLSRRGLAPAPLEMHSEMVDRIAVSLGIETMLDMAVQAVHKLTTSFRVYSMSKRSDNLSMWEWYASKHTGYCLEFARAGLFGIVREVVYDMSYVMDVTDDAHATANWFFYKSPDWSNEEEVRLVLPKHSGGPVLQIDPRLMSRVILGKDMLSTNAEQVRTWAATRVPPVPVVTARWNPLDLTLITDSEPAPGNR